MLTLCFTADLLLLHLSLLLKKKHIQYFSNQPLNCGNLLKQEQRVAMETAEQSAGAVTGMVHHYHTPNYVRIQ